MKDSSHATASHPAGAAPASEPREFDLFISYRRRDGSHAARWLRRRLTTYRLPKPLRAGRPRKLEVYLDTVYERATQDFFEKNVAPAVRGAKHLLVVATPGAHEPRDDGTPNWVQQELATFRAEPQRDNVLVAVARGDFLGPLPGGLEQTFPNIERVDLRKLTPLRFLVWPWAWQLQDELLKVVAPLFGIAPGEMPILRREEQLRWRRNAWLVALASLLVMALISYLVVIKYLQAKDNQARLARALYAQSVLESSAEDGDPARALLLASDALAVANDDDPSWSVYATRAVHLAVPMAHQLVRVPDRLDSLYFHPSGDSALGVGSTGAVLWDTRTGAKLQDLTNVLGPGTQIKWLVFSPDRSRLVGQFEGGAHDGLQSIELSTRRSTPLESYRGYLHHYDFLRVTHDGRRVLLAGESSIEVLDLHDGAKVLPELLDGVPHGPGSLCSTPHRDWLMKAVENPGGTSTLVAIDLATGQPPAGRPGSMQLSGSVQSLLCSRNGQWLVTVSSVQGGAFRLTVWNLETGEAAHSREVEAPYTSSSETPPALIPQDVTADGARVLFLDSNSWIALWNTGDGTYREFHTPRLGFERHISSLQLGKPIRFVAEGSRIAVIGGHDLIVTATSVDTTSPSASYFVELFDAARLEPLSAALALPRALKNLAVTDDGTALLASTPDGRLMRWDLRAVPGPESDVTMPGLEGRVVRGELGPEWALLATEVSSADTQGAYVEQKLQLRLRSLASGKALAEPLFTRFDGPKSIELKAFILQQAGWVVITRQVRSSREQELQLYLVDVQGGRDVLAQPVRLQAEEVGAVALSEDKARLLLYVRNTKTLPTGVREPVWTLQPVDLATGTLPPGIPESAFAQASAGVKPNPLLAALLAQGKYLLDYDWREASLRLWDTASRTVAVRLPVSRNSETARRLLQVLLSGAESVEVSGSTAVRVEFPRGPTWSLSPGPGGTHIRDASQGFDVLLPQLPSKFLSVERAVPSPDGRFLAILAQNRGALQIQIWELRTGGPVGPPLELATRMLDMAFTPDSGSLWTLSADGQARRWSITAPWRHKPGWLPRLAEATTGMKLFPAGVALQDPGTLKALRQEVAAELDQAAPEDGAARFFLPRFR